MNLFFGIVLACQLTAKSEGARILAVWMFNVTSHWRPVEPLLHELASRGHQVTVFSPFPQKSPFPNYTDVDFSDRMPPSTNELTVDTIRATMPGVMKTVFFAHEHPESSCPALQWPEFRRLLASRDRFDLMISDVFGSDCFSYVAQKLEIPFVGFITFTAVAWVSERTGLPDNPAYVPNVITGYVPEMDLWQRTFNTFFLLYCKALHYLVFAEWTRRSAEGYIGEPLSPLSEVVANTSLLLINSYHALAQSRPFPPNVIEVGGLHIGKKKPIPEDLQQILGNAEKGVIIMSFGSQVRTSTLPKSTILMFMRAFAKMPQTVLFKYEEDLPEAPPNVIIRKWLPQRDLVEHERVVAVVGHGGLHSTIEAVHFGKPLVGVPFFGDQPGNVAAVARRGAGVALDIDSLTQEDVERALNSVVNDPTYKENMRELSLQFRDRPMSPLDTAVFWVEYVIRHRGARHLRPASVDLPFYQYLLLDVASLLATALAALLYLAYFLCKRTYALFLALQGTKFTLQYKKIN